MIIKKSEAGKLPATDIAISGWAEKYISEILNREYTLNKHTQFFEFTIADIEHGIAHKLTEAQIKRLVAGFQQNGWKVKRTRTTDRVSFLRFS